MTVVARSFLVDNGFGENDYLLNINGALRSSNTPLPAPWNLPSRLFRSPIEVGESKADGSREIGMMHPGLSDHPFIRKVAEMVGEPLSPGGAPNAHGVSNQRNAQWWHAVDLVSSGHWRELIETRQFTTPDLIAGAIVYALNHRGDDGARLTTKNAREMLAAIGFAEPAAKVAHLCSVLSGPLYETHSSGQSWFVRCAIGSGSGDRAWGLVLGLEAGWFAYDRAGFLCWSEMGRDSFAAGPADTFTERATGQLAFAF